ncbi:U3 small nucleolar RNA-associated protein [Scheffersomyces spartinae]|uniref:U3 small nucleolar RNA-associated protein n=1 Tax=Scheffersomyces spartinae TaxID=45513 RepID=A0A9P8AHS6_9ASCO|nr:U3 small nucleolar RNA-associated protein [Scheffersomyces spartinae]KAG7193004.1 U3 small nucleolar RNA-associated protein [Scheffersomyces spartinae]
MEIHRCRFVDYTPHTITATAFSHDSGLHLGASSELRLAVGRSNGDIEIWNPQHGWKHELILPGSKGRSIEGLVWAVQPNETPRLFSVGGSTYITEWDLKSGRPLANYDCNSGIIWSIDINKDNTKLAIGCDDGSVVIVDITGGPGLLEHDMICQRQNLRVLSIKWANNERLVGGCADARIRCWSASGETRGRLTGTARVDKSKTESTLVWSVVVLPDKGQVVSGDSTGSVKFWDLENFTLLQSFKVHDADVLCLTKDSQQEKIFSAGVDRKIHQFTLISTSKNTRWVHSFNRLLHSNDVRTMSTFECKGYSLLVSGGVERAIVVQKLDQFQDGKYRKLLINQQHSNVVVNKENNLIALFQDQQVKIWSLVDEKHKLVAKLTLADDENITSIDFNRDASLLVVATLSSIKVFELSVASTNGKLKVLKLRDLEFSTMIDGAKQVKLYGGNKLLVLTTEDELYKFGINEEEQKITLEGEIETVATVKSSPSRIQHFHSINKMAIWKDVLVVSRFDGSIEVYSLGEGLESDGYLLTRLSVTANLLEFSDANKLLVVTDENKLYEFYITSDAKNSNNNSLLTDWSKRNSEYPPRQFVLSENRPQGMFVKDNRCWIFGSTWVAFFDLTLNIPMTKLNQGVTSKKRNRDGLSIGNASVVDDQLVDGSNDVYDSNNVELLELSLKQRQIDKLRNGEDDDENDGVKDKIPFWFTSKYRPIMTVGDFGDDSILIIERPQLMLPNTAAFNLPKLNF